MLLERRGLESALEPFEQDSLFGNPVQGDDEGVPEFPPIIVVQPSKTSGGSSVKTMQSETPLFTGRGRGHSSLHCFGATEFRVCIEQGEALCRAGSENDLHQYRGQLFIGVKRSGLQGLPGNPGRILHQCRQTLECIGRRIIVESVEFRKHASNFTEVLNTDPVCPRTALPSIT